MPGCYKNKKNECKEPCNWVVGKGCKEPVALTPKALTPKALTPKALTPNAPIIVSDFVMTCAETTWPTVLRYKKSYPKVLINMYTTSYKSLVIEMDEYGMIVYNTDINIHYHYKKDSSFWNDKNREIVDVTKLRGISKLEINEANAIIDGPELKIKWDKKKTPYYFVNSVYKSQLERYGKVIDTSVPKWIGIKEEKDMQMIEMIPLIVEQTALLEGAYANLGILIKCQVVFKMLTEKDGKQQTFTVFYNYGTPSIEYFEDNKHHTFAQKTQDLFVEWPYNAKSKKRKLSSFAGWKVVDMEVDFYHSINITNMLVHGIASNMNKISDILKRIY